MKARLLSPLYVFIAVLLTVCIPSIKAQDTETTSASTFSFSDINYSLFAGGSIIFFPHDNGIYSDPMHILPSPGIGLRMEFSEVFSAEATLDLYFATYGYSDFLGRAVPMSWENRTAFVWGNLLSIQAVRRIDFNETLGLRIFGGLGFDLRMVFRAPDLHPLDPLEEIDRQTKLVSEYFWGGGRWFLPVVGTGLDINLNEKIRLGLDLRAWIPLYALMGDEDLSDWEGWRFGIGFRVLFLNPIK